jgi:hypothetical protein
MRRRPLNLTLLATAVAVGTAAAPALAQGKIARTDPFDPEILSVEAYVYLYPLVLMDVTRKQMTNVEKWDAEKLAAPMNTLGHLREFPSPDFRTVVRPNFDTLYTSFWLDLTTEPVLLEIPDSKGRYFLMPALDMWTDVIAAPGWRTTGTRAATFAFCPPGWDGELPEGATRVDAPTPYLWVIGRTQTNGEKDYDAVHKFQNGMKLTPLSYWGLEWTPPTNRIDRRVNMDTPPMKQVRKMNGRQFFEYAAKLMKLHPPKATDFSQVARLARIGLVPGQSFDYRRLGASARRAIDAAPARALLHLRERTSELGYKVDGWQMLVDTMGSYGIEYDQRAAVALFGLGANQVADAVYPQLLTAADGKPLTGSERYVLHFEKDQLPPANAFWSITLYDENGFPVPNPTGRLSLSSWMDLKYDRDGSLDLFFQAQPPGKEKEANWLPTPAEGIWNLTMRIYAPRQQVLDGTWAPTPIRRVGGSANLTGADGLPTHRRK